jgi:hypothetical protein
VWMGRGPGYSRDRPKEPSVVRQKSFDMT